MLTVIASISASSSSLILGFQNREGASQNSLTTFPLEPLLEGEGEEVSDAWNFFRKSPKEFWNSEGAAGCGCWVPGPAMRI